MALPSTIHRFEIQVSDVDRGVYESVDLRVARHPSEVVPYLMTRVIAYALELRPGIAFGPGGLSSPDEPPISVPGEHGDLALWVEIGAPSAAKLHKVTKLARDVRVYTYKDIELVMAELNRSPIHRAEAVEVIALPAALLDGAGEHLGRKNAWELLRTEGTVYLTVDGQTFQGHLDVRRLA